MAIPSLEFGKEDFVGRTFPQRISKIAIRLADAGYRLVELHPSPAHMYYIEQFQSPPLCVGEKSLALFVLGEKVPISIRYDGVRTIHVVFRPADRAIDATVFAAEVELCPEEVPDGQP